MTLISEPLPLKKTSALGAYKEDAIIPVPYGDLSKAPMKPVHLTGNTYLCAPFPCVSIDGVLIDDQETSGFESTLINDPQGNVYQAITLAAPAPDGSAVTVRLKGKPSAKTGALMENPADIIEDLYRMIGSTINLNDFYNECNNDDLRIAGVIDSEMTARAVINEIAESVGAIWTRDSSRLYPAPVPLEQSNTFDRYDFRNIKPGTLKASASVDRAADRLRVEFDHISASNEFGSYVELVAQPERYQSEKVLSAKWLRGNASAVKVGARILERVAGTTLALSFDTDTLLTRPAAWSFIEHPYLPAPGYFMSLTVNKSVTSNRCRITGEIIVDRPQLIKVLNSSQRIVPAESAAVEAAIEDGNVIFTVTDDQGNSVVGATAYLDNIGPRVSDGQGRVTFEYIPGVHILGIEAPDRVPISIEVTL